MTATPTLDPNVTLAALITQDAGRAAVLDRLGLDYCCHGQRTLADACADAGLIPQQIETALLAGTRSGPAVPPAPGDAAALASHIQATHHVYLQAELPALVELAHKVKAVHGARHPELAEVQRLVDTVEAEMIPHLIREEQVVFPALSNDGDPTPDLAAMIAGLRIEHEGVGALVTELRAVSGGYEVPADGCASYEALYRRLAHLEADTHLHIHLENNVLFPEMTAATARAR